MYEIWQKKGICACDIFPQVFSNSGRSEMIELEIWKTHDTSSDKGIQSNVAVYFHEDDIIC